MTGRDKTEDQLLSSIRKNKPAAEVPAKAAVKKVAPRRAAAPGPASRPKPESRPKSEPAAAPVFQFGRRVWPD